MVHSIKSRPIAFMMTCLCVTATLAIPPTISLAATSAVYYSVGSLIYRSDLDGSDPTQIWYAGQNTDIGRLVLDDEQRYLYWVEYSTLGGPEVRRVDLESWNSETVVQFDEFDSLRGLALDTVQEKVYWSVRVQGEDRVIQRADLDGNNIETVVEPVDNDLHGIRVDAVAGKIYWTAAPDAISTGRIRRTDIEGDLSGIPIEDLVTGLVDPIDVALDIEAGKMYWSDAGTGKIQRADLDDGQNVEDIDTSSNQPSAIALDLETGKVYWTDPGAGTVRRANLDGSNVEDVVTEPYGPSGLDLLHGDPVSVAEDNTSYDRVRLEQALPNPFRPATRIRFDLARGGQTTLEVFDVTGRLVTTLVSRALEAGPHEAIWNGKTDAGASVPGGFYFYRLRSAGKTKTGRMTLVR